MLAGAWGAMVDCDQIEQKVDIYVTWGFKLKDLNENFQYMSHDMRCNGDHGEFSVTAV
jgi:hypothetical protein